MAKKYLFFVNAAYCYLVFRPIQQEIVKRGDKAAWFFAKGVEPKLESGETLLESEAKVKEYMPDVVFGAGDFVPHYFSGLKVMLFHGMAINKRADKNDAHYNIRHWYDLYCTHSQTDTARFEELAQKHKNFFVKMTGWSKLDNLLGLADQRDKEGKKSIFFASTFSPSMTAAPIVLETLKKLSKKYKILATLHPLMAQEVVDQYRSAESEDFEYLEPEANLYEAMLRSDVMLCDTSSIMYEYMFLNRPLVTFRSRNLGDFAINVEETSQIEEAIEKALANPADRLRSAKELCKKLHAFDDGKSSARVLDAVDEVLAKPDLSIIKNKPLNLIRKLKLRKRLGYWRV